MNSSLSGSKEETEEMSGERKPLEQQQERGTDLPSAGFSSQFC